MVRVTLNQSRARGTTWRGCSRSRKTITVADTQAQVNPNLTWRVNPSRAREATWRGCSRSRGNPNPPGGAVAGVDISPQQLTRKLRKQKRNPRNEPPLSVCGSTQTVNRTLRIGVSGLTLPEPPGWNPHSSSQPIGGGGYGLSVARTGLSSSALRVRFCDEPTNSTTT